MGCVGLLEGEGERDGEREGEGEGQPAGRVTRPEEDAAKESERARSASSDTKKDPAEADDGAGIIRCGSEWEWEWECGCGRARW